MRKLALKISIILLISSVFFINHAVLLAQTQNEAVTADLLAGSEQTADSQQLPDQKALKRMEFLQNIRNEIRSSQKDFQNSTKDVTDSGTRLAEVQKQESTLKGQLDNLDEQITTTSSLVLNVNLQINEKETQLVQLYQEMEVKKAAIENQKKMLVEYLQMLYQQESGITDTTGDNEQISIAKLLLSDQSVGDQLQQLKYFGIMENTGREIFDRLEALLNELQADRVTVQDQKDKLSLLYAQLTDEKQNLDVERNAKARLLEETKGEEKIYQQLYEESKQQQLQEQTDLDTLRDNLKFIQDKITELGDNFNPAEYASLLSPQSSSVYDFINQDSSANEPVFHWPVSPSRGISAYFHDPSYLAAFGFVHNAIDIRTPQGSIIRAPADGIVYKVRDNGYGYSYLILAHKGGYMTVYGHVSEFKVQEGEKVFSGQEVALSGGTPGSKGAGLMTTGAHLHFEMMKGGKYIDPLFSLPLAYLPVETLPDKYQILVTGNNAKVRRVSPGEIQSTQEGDLTQMIERNAALEELTGKAMQDQSPAN